MTFLQLSPERNACDAFRAGGRETGTEEGSIRGLSVPKESSLLIGAQGQAPGGASAGPQRALPWAVALPSPHVLPGFLNFPLCSLHFPTASPPFPPHPTAAGWLEVGSVPELIKNFCTLPLNRGHVPLSQGNGVSLLFSGLNNVQRVKGGGGGGLGWRGNQRLSRTAVIRHWAGCSADTDLTSVLLGVGGGGCLYFAFKRTELQTLKEVCLRPHIFEMKDGECMEASSGVLRRFLTYDLVRKFRDCP